MQITVIIIVSGTIYLSKQVTVVCETRDWEHAQELRKTLLEQYKWVVFSDTPLALSIESS